MYIFIPSKVIFTRTVLILIRACGYKDIYEIRINTNKQLIFGKINSLHIVRYADEKMRDVNR